MIPNDSCDCLQLRTCIYLMFYGILTAIFLSISKQNDYHIEVILRFFLLLIDYYCKGLEWGIGNCVNITRKSPINGVTVSMEANNCRL